MAESERSQGSAGTSRVFRDGLLEGTVCLVSGAGTGLGRETALELLRLGASVVGCGRRAEPLAETAALAAGLAGEFGHEALDIREEEAVDAFFDRLLERHGRLDVLVNNAGYANVGAIEELPEDDFRAQIETNLWGVINVTRAALPVLREQGSGHIIQISSVGGRVTSAGIGPYQTAKWAVEGFSGVLAKEVEPLGIKVTIVEPGGFRTDWAGSSMTMHEVREAYRPTVGAMAEYRARAVALGDPAKGAQAILRIANEEHPPLRILLGSDAYRVAREADEARIASDEAWKALTFSTDSVPQGV